MKHVISSFISHEAFAESWGVLYGRQGHWLCMCCVSDSRILSVSLFLNGAQFCVLITLKIYIGTLTWKHSEILLIFRLKMTSKILGFPMWLLNKMFVISPLTFCWTIRAPNNVYSLIRNLILNTLFLTQLYKPTSECYYRTTLYIYMRKTYNYLLGV